MFNKLVHAPGMCPQRLPHLCLLLLLTLVGGVVIGCSTIEAQEQRTGDMSHQLATDKKEGADETEKALVLLAMEEVDALKASKLTDKDVNRTVLLASSAILFGRAGDGRYKGSHFFDTGWGKFTARSAWPEKALPRREARGPGLKVTAALYWRPELTRPENDDSASIARPGQRTTPAGYEIAVKDIEYLE